jgi:hypothetical protein
MEQELQIPQDRVNPDFREEFREIIASRNENPHLDFLLRELAKDTVSTRTLFRYGMDHLPQNLDRPDMDLSIFFLTLSELKSMPADAQSLALDLMIYCENEPDGPDSLRPDLIPGEYERVVPMLK